MSRPMVLQSRILIQLFATELVRVFVRTNMFVNQRLAVGSVPEELGDVSNGIREIGGGLKMVSMVEENITFTLIVRLIADTCHCFLHIFLLKPHWWTGDFALAVFHHFTRPTVGNVVVAKSDIRIGSTRDVWVCGFAELVRHAGGNASLLVVGLKALEHGVYVRRI